MSEIIYMPISPEKYDDVIRHLRCSFFVDEPLNKCLSISKRGQPHPELEEFSLSILSQGISFMGIDGTTGEVVGVVLNGYNENEDQHLPKKTYKDQKVQKIFDFLENVDKDVDYLSNFNAKDILEVKILSVDSKYRGRGIAGNLYSITENYARSKDYALLRTDATALYSQKVFEKLGFKTLKEVFYDEYPSKDAPTFIVEPPHVSYKLMVKKLRC